MKLFHGGKTPLVFPIDVACAVIRQSGRVLITRRRPGDHLGGLWEFPGGKRVAPESLGATLEREIWEELTVRIRTGRFLRRIDYQYPGKRVSLYFYECVLLEGTPRCRGCDDFRWVRPFELKRFTFPPADALILEDIRAGRV